MMAGGASAQLREIAVALREAGDRGNMNALRRGIRAEATPLIGAVRDAARSRLPKSGGLNEFEASQKIRVAVLSGARTTAVRIVGRASQDTDTGDWRHPVPNRTATTPKWVEQSYGPAAGWWTKTMERKSPEATALIVAELEKVAARIRSV